MNMFYTAFQIFLNLISNIAVQVVPFSVFKQTLWTYVFNKQLLQAQIVNPNQVLSFGWRYYCLRKFCGISVLKKIFIVLLLYLLGLQLAQSIFFYLGFLKTILNWKEYLHQTIDPLFWCHFLRMNNSSMSIHSLLCLPFWIKTWVLPF